MEENRRQRFIEQYLSGELSAGERERFRQEMESDEELRAEVALHRMLQEEFGDRPRQELIQKLDTLGEQYFGPPPPSVGRKGWRLILAVILVVLAGSGVIWLSLSSPAPEEARPDTEERIPHAPEAPVFPEPPNTSRQEGVPAQPAPPEHEDRTSGPVAQANPADFAPNPYFEGLMNGTVRGEGLRFSAVNARVENGQFILQGQVRKPAAEERSLAVFVYSNKEQDYIDGNVLLRFPLNLQPDMEVEPVLTPAGEELQAFDFTVAERVTWRPGLYYYFLAWEQEEEPLYIGTVRLSAD
ncbi:MAG: hypothetical protein KDD06_16885 [Phaeodactylibacter sp.]|nr:hypothetical protein [Phaeodactylibacter sp.]MCB9263514.1 hypothetical protein [Lewinellaceae bacterium]MCB9287609.1 hypothetical protein [Lewinellaceae bacterium]